VITELAPAKINLYLHVLGKRQDGYHDLDSLVVFAPDCADTVRLEQTDKTELQISGPFADVVPTAKNSLLAAQATLQTAVGRRLPVRMHCTKTLPAGAGLGGGTADAAAVLRGLNKLYGLGLSQAKLAAIGATIGADVPVCVYSQVARMQGLGEQVTPLDITLPDCTVLLVWPNMSIATHSVFQALQTAFLSTPPDAVTLESDTIDSLIASLKPTTNHLLAGAVEHVPVIADIVSALLDTGAVAAQMSGSGSACFGIFRTRTEAKTAQHKIQDHTPNAWVGLSSLC
jgi:4-diphosphocytidyl-2-C-methyl-D-erythritol kinase